MEQLKMYWKNDGKEAKAPVLPEGMETARLRTDDWRIPAIKTYLKIGFEPDLTSEPDYKERWEKIFEIIKK